MKLPTDTLELFSFLVFGNKKLVDKGRSFSISLFITYKALKPARRVAIHPLHNAKIIKTVPLFIEVTQKF